MKQKGCWNSQNGAKHPSLPSRKSAVACVFLHLHDIIMLNYSVKHETDSLKGNQEYSKTPRESNK